MKGALTNEEFAKIVQKWQGKKLMDVLDYPVWGMGAFDTFDLSAGVYDVLNIVDEPLELVLDPDASHPKLMTKSYEVIDRLYPGVFPNGCYTYDDIKYCRKMVHFPDNYCGNKIKPCLRIDFGPDFQTWDIIQIRVIQEFMDDMKSIYTEHYDYAFWSKHRYHNGENRGEIMKLYARQLHPNLYEYAKDYISTDLMFRKDARKRFNEWMNEYKNNYKQGSNQ